MREEPYELEWAKVIGISVIVVIIGGIGTLIYFSMQLVNSQPLIKECANNPTLLHAQACTTAQDCITKCVARLSAKTTVTTPPRNNTPAVKRFNITQTS